MQILRWLLTGALLLAGVSGCDSSPSGETGGSTTSSTGGGGTGATGGQSTGGQTTGGGGSTGGATGGEGGTITPVCAAGSKETCYDGPDGTLAVGVCKGGERTCLPDGSGYGPCEGQVLPAAEACGSAEDEDCDGTANEADAGCACLPGQQKDCYEGPDGTLGVGLCAGGKATCAADGLSFGACEGQVLPAAETCATPGDDDCDGQTNEDGAGCACAPGSVASCYSGPVATQGVGPCHGGMQTCNDQGTGYGPCTGEVVPVTETCNTPVDDDCDGQTNESGAGCVCPPNQNVACYTGPMGTLNVGACKGGTALCNDQGTVLGPCTGEVKPTPETCNTAVDDDCDNQTNEEGAGCVCLPNSVAPCYGGPPGTLNVGICQSGTKTCNAQGTAYGACVGDVQPGTETCATPGDEDCDGTSNEGCPVTYANDIQPIFFANCGGCHTGGGSGGHNIGISYSDTLLPSNVCPGHTIGYCALVRIQNGSMPGGGVTQQQRALIQAWLDGGQLP